MIGILGSGGRSTRLRTALVVIAAFVVMAGPAVIVAVRAQQGSATFSDAEVIGPNRLGAARLDIEVGDRTVPMVGEDLAPGDTRRGSIEFVNEGTIPLRYSMRTLPVEQGTDLAQWLDWSLWWGGSGTDCTAGAVPPGATGVTGTALASGLAIAGDPASGADPGDRVLAVGATDMLCLEARFSLDAPNDVQGRSITQPFRADAEEDRDPAAAAPGARTTDDGDDS